MEEVISKILPSNLIGGEYISKIFRDISLKNMTITDTTFTSCTFEYVRFEGVISTNTKFIDCIFNHFCNFKGSEFGAVQFERVTFSRINFSNAQFEDAVFKSCSFEKANFSHAILHGAYFSQENLKGVTFYQAKMEGANLKGADLEGADLAHAMLNKADLESANLKGADLFLANLKGANLSHANLEGLQALSTNFYEANLVGANLSGANLMAVNALGANFNEANFENVIATGARFKKASFVGANLSGANFKVSDFIEANLTGANLTGANLSYVNFTSANLTNANLTGADLTGAKFQRANITNAIFPDRPGNGRVQPEQLLIPQLEILPSYKIIDRNETALDIIEGDVEMNEYLTSEEGYDSIAFLFQKSYYIINKSNLLQMISSKTGKEKKDNAIVYECKEAGTQRPENIVDNMPLLKIAAIGLPINYSYIPIQYIQDVLRNTSRNLKDRMYEFVRTSKKIQSTVSYQVLYGLTRLVSASHCQEGQGGDIYILKKVKNAGVIVSNAIKRLATAKRNLRLEGGRKKRRNIPSKTRRNVRSKTRTQLDVQQP